MNNTIFKCEFTAVIPSGMVKNYYDHADMGKIKALGFKVEWHIVTLEGGAVHRVRIVKNFSDKFDRNKAFVLVPNILKECDAVDVVACDHILQHEQYLKVDSDIYEICRCIDCGNSFKFEV